MKRPPRKRTHYNAMMSRFKNKVAIAPFRDEKITSRGSLRLRTYINRVIRACQKKNGSLARNDRRYSHKMEVISCAEHVRRETPRRLHAHHFPWRIWAWHTSSRELGRHKR